ncbi:MAG: XRE family transcriptional regulator [Proteobacteria bacterium]|nr:MAG: XRE family transcriptional regulator [Pseudomonadota bacterium]
MDNMLSLDDKSSNEMQIHLAKQMKSLRLSKSLTLATLEDMTGVKSSSIKRFEAIGEVSLKSFLKLAEGLGVLQRFEGVLKPSDEPMTVDELKSMLSRKKSRKRGSK